MVDRLLKENKYMKVLFDFAQSYKLFGLLHHRQLKKEEEEDFDRSDINTETFALDVVDNRLNTNE
jgi:hypothetical protein